MMVRLLQILPLMLFMLVEQNCMARHIDITVSKDSSGDFSTLSDALNSLPMYNYQRCVIYVKNGVYNEKILIDRDYITIIGESNDSTIVEFSILRSDWQANPDYIGAAVVNITADDIILENLTIRNTQPLIGPHAFAVYGTGTRTIILNCNVTSKGGDTVSLWNYKNGMYYHAGCYFEGGVDFVCPRGWCYIRDSRFFENSTTDAIWHASVTDKHQKMVLVNCAFDGIQDYNLGRHHYDAMFYFLYCVFSETMADKPVFWVHSPGEPEKNRPYLYGNRHYYYNCHRVGGDFNWHKNNTDVWPGSVTPSEITAKWSFDGKWDPEGKTAPAMTDFQLTEQGILFYFDELLCVRGKPVLETSSGIKLVFVEGQGRDILRFIPEKKLNSNINLFPLRVISGEILGNHSSVDERLVQEINIHPVLGN